MANPLCEVLITGDQLKTPETPAVREVGAVVEFWGLVRELEDGRALEGIEYEAHRGMAAHQLEKIARKAASDFTLSGVIIRHRIGFVPVGEASLFVRATAAHREEGFRAMQWMIDELKRHAPIWKRPSFKIDKETGNKTGVHAKRASIASRT